MKKLIESYGKDNDIQITLDSDPAKWLSIKIHDKAYNDNIGYVTTMRVGNYEVSMCPTSRQKQPQNRKPQPQQRQLQRFQQPSQPQPHHKTTEVRTARKGCPFCWINSAAKYNFVVWNIALQCIIASQTLNSSLFTFHYSLISICNFALLSGSMWALKSAISDVNCVWFIIRPHYIVGIKYYYIYILYMYFCGGFRFTALKCQNRWYHWVSAQKIFKKLEKNYWHYCIACGIIHKHEFLKKG